LAETGSIIEGKYEILKLIGKGGMSKVYLAMDLRLNKQWAIKEVEKFARDPDKNEIVVNSAIAEAKLIKDLDNYYLPRINDILDNGETIYVVMDYVEGESLQKVIETEGAQPENRVIQWGKQLCEVLDYLHSRRPPIIYRDMKPANVMIKPDGDVKLIDFGIAREYKEQSGSDTTSLGTRGYAAPEQFAGGGQTDVRTDIYNMGATLYHAVTGHDPSKEPYVMYPIRYWNAKLSGGLENILLKCTAASPAERYQSALEALYDLSHYEEIDNAYRLKQKKILRKFILAACLTVFFVAFGLFSLGMRSYTMDQDYMGMIDKAISETDAVRKIEYIQQAIAIDPTRPEAYFGTEGHESDNLVDPYISDDGYFTQEEEAKFREFLNGKVADEENSEQSMRTLWQSQEWYPELARKIGELYWYNYTGSAGADDEERWKNSESDRQKLASGWFADVLEYSEPATNENYNTIQSFYDIGQFSKEMQNTKKDAEGSDVYKEQWKVLKNAFEAVHSEAGGGTNRAKLSVDNVIATTIETYQYQFVGDGVTLEEMKTLLSEVQGDVSSMKNIVTSENDPLSYATMEMLLGTGDVSGALPRAEDKLSNVDPSRQEEATPEGVAPTETVQEGTTPIGTAAQTP
jgi:serine/threonine-protein kinase